MRSEMIISKKRFKEEIDNAVKKALNEQDERRWMDDRFRDMDRSFDYRMDKMNERIRRIENFLFPNEKEKCCENQREGSPCRY